MMRYNASCMNWISMGVSVSTVKMVRETTERMSTRERDTYLKNSLERTTLEVRKYQTGFLGGLGLVGRGVFPLAGCNAERRGM